MTVRAVFFVAEGVVLDYGPGWPRKPVDLCVVSIVFEHRIVLVVCYM